MAIYAGSTPKFLLKIKDEAGIQLNPLLLTQVLQVKVYIFNAITNLAWAKFYLTTMPTGGNWTIMSTSTLSATDIRVRFYLTEAQTNLAEGNDNKIQVNITVPDTETGGTRTIIKTGKFAEIIKAQI